VRRNSLGDAHGELDPRIVRLEQGGTKMIVCVAPVASTASLTVLKTGWPLSIFVPPLPGVTPPTICVPYASIRVVWNSPSRPVIPCTMTFEFLSR
jgi:hypothetical protein